MVCRNACELERFLDKNLKGQVVDCVEVYKLEKILSSQTNIIFNTHDVISGVTREVTLELR